MRLAAIGASQDDTVNRCATTMRSTTAPTTTRTPLAMLNNLRQPIHRVCVTCNNMFETDIEHIDAKHCPVCRRA